MKKLRSVSLMIVVGLLFGVVGPSLATSSLKSMAKGIDATKVFDIIYDGFCDGINVTADNVTGIATGTRNSSCATCPFPDLMYGTVGRIPGHNVSMTLAYDTALGMDLFQVFSVDQTFVIYNANGTEYLSGTWSYCTAAGTPEAGAPSTIGK